MTDKELRIVNLQMDFQRRRAVSGLVCPLLFFGAFIAAGFIPPLARSSSAAEIAGHYREHTAGIRLGAAIMLLSGAFYASYTAVISAQMRRIPGVHRAVVDTQTIAGAFACLTFLVPAMFLCGASFRVMPWPPFMMQNFAFAPIVFTPGAILQSVMDGPFAWTGISVI